MYHFCGVFVLPPAFLLSSDSYVYHHDDSVAPSIQCFILQFIYCYHLLAAYIACLSFLKLVKISINLKN